MRHESCVRDTVTCNCAIAVREGNDILGINACNESMGLTLIRYLRDPKTPARKADIKRQADGAYIVSTVIIA